MVCKCESQPLSRQQEDQLHCFSVVGCLQLHWEGHPKSLLIVATPGELTTLFEPKLSCKGSLIWALALKCGCGKANKQKATYKHMQFSNFISPWLSLLWVLTWLIKHFTHTLQETRSISLHPVQRDDILYKTR